METEKSAFKTKLFFFTFLKKLFILHTYTFCNVLVKINNGIQIYGIH